MNYLELKDISFSFDNVLFENVCLNLGQKDKIAIIGESGCGKSTLLHIMSSFLKPKSGEVHLFGNDLYTSSESEILLLRRHELSIIFQQHYLFKGFKLAENLQLASLLSGKEIEYELLDKFNLTAKQMLHASSLSGGEQQRASIVRSLVKQPKIIFADEPTGNLDEKNSHIVIDTLFDYIDEHNSSIALITHDPNIAKKCDQVYEINNLRLSRVA